MRNVFIGVNADTSLDDLYLDTALTKSDQAVRRVTKVLAMDKSINTEGNVAADWQKITANKEAFIGLISQPLV